MAQAPPHGSCLTVLGGPRDGQTFPLGTAFEELLIGSDASCDIGLDLPGVSPVHAKLLVEAAGVTVSDTHSPAGLFVNDDRVAAPTRLREGDIIWLGAPGEPTSVMLLCHIVAVDVPVVAPLPSGETPVMEMWDAAPAEEQAADEAFFVDAAAVALTAPEAPAFYVEPDVTPSAPAAADDGAFFVADTEPQSAPTVDMAPPVAAPSDAPPLDLVLETSSSEPEPDPAEPFLLDLGMEEPSQPAPAPAAAPTPQARSAAPVPMAAAPKAVPQGRAMEPGAPDVVGAATPAPPAAPAAPTASRPSHPAGATAAPATPRPAPVVPSRARVSAPQAGPPPSAAPAPVARPHGAPPPVASAPVAGAPVGSAEKASPAPATPPAAPPRVSPTAATPKGAARRPAPTPAARTAATRAPSRGRGLLLGGSAAVVLLLAAGGFWGFALWSTPRLDGVTPARAHSGQVVTLSGARFGAGARVLFGGQPGRVVSRSAERIEVEVPELSLAPGPDRPVVVVVQNDGRTSAAISLQAFIAPRLHGIAPDVALPGEEVELAGTGWGPGAEVHFGTLPAEVVHADADTLRVRVPALDGPYGAGAPVTVTMGGATSNTAPFFVGRLPLVLGLRPAAAAPGDVLTISGRGFRTEPGATRVTVGGRPVLTLSATESALAVVVPWRAGAGQVAVEVHVTGLEAVGQSQVSLPEAPPNIDLRFAAEPLDEAPDGALAAVATELGPAFVLAAADGHTAAQRAVDAQNRLNQAAVALKASLGADLEVRFGNPPSLGLRGRPEAVLSATAADAAAYSQASRRAVTSTRLATWWTALARDLVLLLARSERPHFAADLAAEGKALADAFQAGRRAAPFGLPRTVADTKPLQAALRGLALRVPASVPEPALGGTGGTPPTGVPALRLEGAWGGRERVPEGARFIGVTFTARGGTFALEGGLTLSLPLLSLERPQRDSVRFSVRLGGGVRYYSGRWDGQKISGNVSADAAGRDVLGSFELAPR